MASNPVGDIPVVISGDFSDLSDAIDQAQQAAAAGASSIVDAFNVPTLGDGMVTALQDVGNAADAASTQITGFGQGAEGAVDSVASLGDAANTTSESVTGTGDAASGAAGSLDTLGSSAGDAAGQVEQVGSSAEQAESGLSAMAEQLAAVGEALVITEGLKEFGEEALNAYGTVQSVTIGLTALTGSAQKADDVIEQIKSLAATEPFAFPEIAPTVQKMVALGVSTEQIGTVMQAAADASAATGNQFGQVANMLDRMSLSGTANTRAMATLGISTTDLGNAMGVTAGEATKAFAALDQSQRIDVLAQALSKFAGTAIAEAQGISGQWQIFQNQFEEVMVAVGASLAPVVSDILSFGKAVLGGIQVAVEAFGELPKPVQDVVVIMGLLAAAVVPVTGALAAVGLAMSGLSNLLPAVAGLFGSLAEAETEEAAVATGSVASHAAAATAIEAEGAAAEETTVAFGLTGTAAGVLTVGMGALGVAVAAVDLGMIYDEAKELVPEFQDLGNVINQASGFTRDLSEAGTALSTALTALTGSSTTTGDALKSIKDSTDIASQAVGVELKQSLLDAIPGFDGLYSAIFEVKSVIPTLTDVISELTGVWGKLPAPIQAAITKFQAQTDAQTKLSAGVETLSSGIQKIIDVTTKQNSAVQQATAVFNTLNTAYQGNKTLADGTVVTAQMVAAAHKTLAAAVSAATDAVKGHTAATQAEKDSLSAVNTAATALVATYDQASTVYNEVVAAQDGSLQAQAALEIATKNLDTATKALYGDQQSLTTSTGAYGNAAGSAAAQIQAIYNKTNQADSALQTAIQVYNQVRQATIDGTASQATYNVAWNNLVTAFQAANPQMTTAKSNIQDVGAAAMKAAQADDSWTGSHGDLITVLKNGTSTQVEVAQYTQQIGDNSATAATDVGKLGDAWSLMDVTISDGSGTIKNVVQAVTDLDAAENTITADTVDMSAEYTDYEKLLSGQVDPAIQKTQSDLDIFDTSMIKIDTDTTSATTSMANYGAEVINTDGTITNLTDLLKTLNAQWNQTTQDIDQATAAYVMWDQVTGSSGSSGSGGSKGINASGYFVKPGETTEQALDATFQSLNNTLGGGYNVNPATGYSTSTAPQSPSIPVPSGYAASGTGVTTSGGTGVSTETSEAMSGGTLIPAGSALPFAEAVQGPSLDAPVNNGTQGSSGPGPEITSQPPIYQPGTGVPGTPIELMSIDGGLTWGDAGYGTFAIPTGTGVTTDAAGNQLDYAETQIQDAIIKTGANVTSLTDAGATFTAATQAIAQAAGEAEAEMIGGPGNGPTTPTAPPPASFSQPLGVSTAVDTPADNPTELGIQNALEAAGATNIGFDASGNPTWTGTTGNATQESITQALGAYLGQGSNAGPASFSSAIQSQSATPLATGETPAALPAWAVAADTAEYQNTQLGGLLNQQTQDTQEQSYLQGITSPTAAQSSQLTAIQSSLQTIASELTAATPNYGTQITAPTLTPAQEQALISAANNLGSGAVPQQISPTFNVTINTSSQQTAAQIGTTTVNALRSLASQLKY